MNTENQSVFSAQQEVLQAPPVPELPPDAPVKKRSRLLFVFGGFGLLMVGLLAVMVMVGNPNNGAVAPEPTVTPVPVVAVEQSRRDEIFSELSEKVKQANPKIEVLAPPPIDMKVEF